VNFSGLHTIPAGTTFEMNSGSMTGAGTLNINGPFSWTGGTISVPNVNLNGGATFTSHVLSASTMTNAAGQTIKFLTNNGNGLLLANGSVFNNAGSIIGDSYTSFLSGGGALSTFNNSGTYTGTNGSSIGGIVFNNTGNVNVAAGAGLAINPSTGS